MSSYLHRLYSGMIMPVEQIASAEWQPKKDTAFLAYEAYRNQLNEEELKDFDQMFEQQLHLMCKENETFYIEGFRQGAQMMLEVLDGE